MKVHYWFAQELYIWHKPPDLVVDWITTIWRSGGWRMTEFFFQNLWDIFISAFSKLLAAMGPPWHSPPQDLYWPHRGQRFFIWLNIWESIEDPRPPNGSFSVEGFLCNCFLPMLPWVSIFARKPNSCPRWVLVLVFPGKMGSLHNFC